MEKFSTDIDDIFKDSVQNPLETNVADKEVLIDLNSLKHESTFTKEDFTFNVEDIISGSDTDKVGEKDIPTSKQKSELESLCNRLKMWSEKCTHKLVDLRTVDFVCSSDDMYLKFKESDYYSRPLYFKFDPNNPGDSKVIHALCQFSKIIGIPPKFFMENRPKLRMDIVKNFQAGLEATEEKAQCLVHFRETRDFSVIRALTPVTHSTIANFELVDTIIKGSEVPLGLLFVHGDEKDDLILHARILSLENTYEALGRKFCTGFSLVASELGSSQLIIDACVHDIESNTSYMASYGKGPYFKSKYETLQPKQIREIFGKLVLRIQEESKEMVDRISQRVESDPRIVPIEETFAINRMKGITSKVSKLIYQQVSSCEEEIKSPMDFARHVSLVAKDFDSLKRLEIERAAGTYLNLIFSKA